jgi:hypothetical protein
VANILAPSGDGTKNPNSPVLVSESKSELIEARQPCTSQKTTKKVGPEDRTKRYKAATKRQTYIPKAYPGTNALQDYVLQKTSRSIRVQTPYRILDT